MTFLEHLPVHVFDDIVAYLNVADRRALARASLQLHILVANISVPITSQFGNYYAQTQTYGHHAPIAMQSGNSFSQAQANAQQHSFAQILAMAPIPGGVIPTARYLTPHPNNMLATSGGSSITWAANTAGSSGSSFTSAANGFDSHTSSDTEFTSFDDDQEEHRFNKTDLLQILNKHPKLPKQPFKANLPTLPNELQLEIFKHLDKIDSCCLGLSFRRAYIIFHSIFGAKMSLSTRRVGPNLLERAWEVVGKQECGHCGIYRCELHQHIKTWMPAGLEYCSFKGMFGRKAAARSAENCFRAKPSKPRRCGRHPLRTTSVHQDGSMALQKLA